MITTLRHIAIQVGDLQAAELFYRTVFEMELTGREALLNDGLWYTLPFDKGWEDAKAAGIELGMCALRYGSFVLALFCGEAVTGQVYAIGLGMPTQEIAGVRGRLPKTALVLEEGPESLTFLDPYQINWQISGLEVEFRTAGDFANRWLQL
jgi:catechol 2,3-dioxygenase-like lactoylglutathione lyase family enzyme